MMISKNKKWSLGQTGGVAGPETSKKNLIFEAIRKKPKIEKIASKIGWNHKEDVLGYFPRIFWPPGGTLWGVCPLRRSLLFTLVTLSLKKSMSISLDLLKSF